MLEEKILAALEKMQADISGLKKGQDAMQSDISGIKVRLDTEIERKLNLLAEGQELMLEKLERLDDMEVMDTRITALEAMVKKLNRDIEKLKRAQELHCRRILEGWSSGWHLHQPDRRSLWITHFHLSIPSWPPWPPSTALKSWSFSAPGPGETIPSAAIST